MILTLIENLHESLPYCWVPDNHYGNRYLKFVLHFKSIRLWTCKKKGFHRHHILPKHYKKWDHPLNLVPLTPREHALAHLLLFKATGHYKDAWAVCRTLRDNTGSIRTTRFLEQYKRNPVASEETRKRQSDIKKKLVESGWKPHNSGTAGTKNPKAVEAAKRAWDTRRKNGNDKMSEEQKVKIRESVIRTKRNNKMI